MKIDLFRNLKCFKCSGFGHRTRDIPSKADQNRLPVNATDEGTDDNDKPDGTQNQGLQKGRKPQGKEHVQTNEKGLPPNDQELVKTVAQGQVPPQVLDWIREAECWICHRSFKNLDTQQENNDQTTVSDDMTC